MILDQIPLPLPFKPATGRADFMISACNKAAIQALEMPESWLYNTLILTGPAGSGKTHLAAVWQQETGAIVLPSSAVTVDWTRTRLCQEKRSLVIEKVDEFCDENGLFHLINDACQRQYQILLTAAVHRNAWPIGLPDLASRLRAAPHVRIAPPDETVLAAVLIKQLSDRRIEISPEVLAYILPRMERSFAFVKKLAEDLDRAALSRKSSLTVPLTRSVMAHLSPSSRTEEPAGKQINTRPVGNAHINNRRSR